MLVFRFFLNLSWEHANDVSFPLSSIWVYFLTFTMVFASERLAWKKIPPLKQLLTDVKAKP